MSCMFLIHHGKEERPDPKTVTTRLQVTPRLQDWSALRARKPACAGPTQCPASFAQSSPTGSWPCTTRPRRPRSRRPQPLALAGALPSCTPGREADQVQWAGVLNFWFLGRVFDEERPSSKCQQRPSSWPSASRGSRASSVVRRNPHEYPETGAIRQEKAPTENGWAFDIGGAAAPRTQRLLKVGNRSAAGCWEPLRTQSKSLPECRSASRFSGHAGRRERASNSSAFWGRFNSRNRNRTRVRCSNQEYAHLHPIQRGQPIVRRMAISIAAQYAVNNLRMRRMLFIISA
jgi:hypothetical protein